MVLRGTGLLRWCPPVLFESGPGRREVRADARDLFSLFTEEHGYSVYLLKAFLAGAPARLRRLRPAHEYPFLAFNTWRSNDKSLTACELTTSDARSEVARTAGQVVYVRLVDLFRGRHRPNLERPRRLSAQTSRVRA